jgi:ATP-dependent Zn protease
MDDARLSTAWHEAAHAVLCVLFEMPFTTVTIVPTDDYAGAVHPDNEAIAAHSVV